jgi:hypothetical protein
MLSCVHLATWSALQVKSAVPEEAAHAVVQEAVTAGVWVFGTGVGRQKASVVATDGTVDD